MFHQEWSWCQHLLRGGLYSQAELLRSFSLDLGYEIYAYADVYNKLNVVKGATLSPIFQTYKIHSHVQGRCLPLHPSPVLFEENILYSVQFYGSEIVLFFGSARNVSNKTEAMHWNGNTTKYGEKWPSLISLEQCFECTSPTLRHPA